jgi:hypothetical protein
MATIQTELTRKELEELIERAVWSALSRLLEDPDYGLPLQEAVVERLKREQDLDEAELLSASQAALDLGLKW